jgi:DNA-binding NtrC family response regulator
MHRILIVDDEAGVRHSFKKAFGREYVVDTAEDGATALEKIKLEPPALVVMDIKMPGLSGMEVLRSIRESHPEVPVVMMTAHSDTQKAIEAMKMGALDYLRKPLQKEDIKQVIKKALRLRRVLERTDFAFLEEEGADLGNVLIGNNERMIEIYKLIGQVAHADVAVLIRGESGTGKEVVAKAIHENSRRLIQPFVVVNCAAVPEGLLETELFGYEQGAFTGASAKPKPGRFEVCDGGTLLLDEIGDMSLMTQAKVLRVLQNGEFQKVGGVETLIANVRILAATNKDLEEEIEEGRFRDDLFHRINVVSIDIPPLRERKEDIVDLVRYMIRRFNPQLGVEIRGAAPEFIEALVAHDWPGNVRELENVTKKAMVVCKTNILSLDDCRLPGEAGTERRSASVHEEFAGIAKRLLTQTFASSDSPFDEIVGELEKRLIEHALDMTQGNQVKASSLLGIARTTLRKKIEGYGISFS